MEFAFGILPIFMGKLAVSFRSVMLQCESRTSKTRETTVLCLLNMGCIEQGEWI